MDLINQYERDCTNAAFQFLLYSKHEDFPMTETEYAHILHEFRTKKGDEAIEGLAGFFVFMCNEEKKDTNFVMNAIYETFAHDLQERHDIRCLPRSSEYHKFWKEAYQDYRSWQRIKANLLVKFGEDGLLHY